jgi:hypothetical protein
MDIEQLKRKYYYKLNEIDKSYVKSEMRTEGPQKAIEKHLKYIDCTRCMKNGMRIIQTINKNYKFELCRLIYMIEILKEAYGKQVDSYCEEMYDIILSIHDKNLEFEKEVPPIVYVDKRKKPTKRGKRKEGNLFEESNESKFKEKIKAIKLGGFKFIKN